MGRATFAEEASAPDTPSAGFVTLYFLASGSGVPVTKDDGGNVKTVVLAEAANTFTAAQKINVSSTTALLVEDDGVIDNVLVVDTATDNGRIGLGTVSPARSLVVENSDGSDNTIVAIVATSTSASSFLDFSDNLGGGGLNGGRIEYDHSANSMEFFTNSSGTAKLIITSAGFLAINSVASPSTALDIGAGAMEFEEMTAPAAGAANTARLFSQDSGGGKTQLAVRFNTGAIQILATEP